MTTYIIKQGPSTDKNPLYSVIIDDSVIDERAFYDNAWDFCANRMRQGDTLIEIHGKKTLSLDYAQVRRIQRQLQEYAIFDEVPGQ